MQNLSVFELICRLRLLEKYLAKIPAGRSGKRKIKSVRKNWHRYLEVGSIGLIKKLLNVICLASLIIRPFCLIFLPYYLQEKAVSAQMLASNTIRLVMGPTGTTVTFPRDMGFPSIFDSKPSRYCQLQCLS